LVEIGVKALGEPWRLSYANGSTSSCIRGERILRGGAKICDEAVMLYRDPGRRRGMVKLMAVPIMWRG